MTFADLMTLLMCFFVLLLSFSELDMIKYKKIAGSMEFAFGVQREIKVKDVPKGTSIIAREFSPGKPLPSAIKVMQQKTIDLDRQALEFTDSDSRKSGQENKEGNGPILNDDKQRSMAVSDADSAEPEKSGPENPTLSMEQVAESSKLDPKELKQTGSTKAVEQSGEGEESGPLQQAFASKASVSEFQRVLESLREEVRQGLIDLDLVDGQLIIRIHESGSFRQGVAELNENFIPVVDRLGAVLEQLPGDIRVAGHTDSLKLNGGRYRSNWGLSSARAVSVVHELLAASAIEPTRIIVEGFGDSRPMAPNDSEANRAKNRRVEITLNLGELFIQ